MSTWIKFCGTTTVEDALASVDAGADALGFIFAESKRRITPERAQEIIQQLPAKVERIGVFAQADVDELLRYVMRLDLTGIQLHGMEMPFELCSYLPKARRAELRIIKSVIVDDYIDVRLPMWMKAAAELVDAWLIDSGAGSGKTFDWRMMRSHFDRWQGGAQWKDVNRLAGNLQRKFIIAGGLTPGNVGEAIRTFFPWGVDVVSGIEREPGRKDPVKMKAFVEAVRKAEHR